LARQSLGEKGILLGFRMGAIVDMSIDARRQPFFDKSTYPVRAISAADGVRIVPAAPAFAMARTSHAESSACRRCS